MRGYRAIIVLVLWSCIAAAASVRAHHSVLGFDGRRGVTLTGTVRKIVWANPHTVLVIDGDSGGRWTVESEGPGVLMRLGWSREAIAVGDRIRTIGAPARDGTHRLRCDFVRAPSGSRLPCYPAKSL